MKLEILQVTIKTPGHVWNGYELRLGPVRIQRSADRKDLEKVAEFLEMWKRDEKRNESEQGASEPKTQEPTA